MQDHRKQQVTGRIKASRRRHQPAAAATHKRPVSSDQAPGEETVQVNDQYVGGGPPPHSSSGHDQHQTGG